MDIENKINQILKIVITIQQEVTEMKQDIATLKEDMAELKDRVTSLEEKVTSLEEKVTRLEERVTSLEKRVTSLERSVTLIEFDHGQKLSALFDNMKVNEDAHKRIEQSISNFKSEIQGTLLNHEKRISSLEGNLVPSF